MKKRKIFKKLFILLPNIQMTTINTLNPFNLNVVRDDTNKKWKKRLLWLANFALWGTLLFGKVSDWNAQEIVTQERNEITKEIVVSKTQADIDSTISYDEAKQLLNEEKIEISTEEIQEYIMNNREEFEEYVKNNVEELNKIIDKETMDMLYEEIENNEDIKSMINKMVNRDDIKIAAMKGNTEYIQKQIKIALNDINSNRYIKQSLSFGAFMLFFGLFIGFFIGEMKGKKINRKNE